jgi:3-dehydrosphinganine reductase
MDTPPWAVALAVVGSALGAAVLAWLATRPPFYSLRGKVVLVTGGSSGIGKATAAAALSRGAHVALLARRDGLLRAAAAELAPLAARGGQRVTTHVGDVADEASTAAAVAAAAAAHGGRLDVLVHSAGVSLAKRFEDSSLAEWESTLRVNVLGSRNAVAAALPFLPTRVSPGGGPPGRIVLVSSQAGQTGVYGYTAYSVRVLGGRVLWLTG